MGLSMPDALVIVGLLTTILVAILKLEGRKRTRKEDLMEQELVDKKYCDLMHKNLDDKTTRLESKIDGLVLSVNSQLAALIKIFKHWKGGDSDGDE